MNDFWRSCDTEDCSNDALITEIYYILQYMTLCENPAWVFFYIDYFLHKTILHIVKIILWKYILGIFNIDGVRPCQVLKS